MYLRFGIVSSESSLWRWSFFRSAAYISWTYKVLIKVKIRYLLRKKPFTGSWCPGKEWRSQSKCKTSRWNVDLVMKYAATVQGCLSHPRFGGMGEWPWYSLIKKITQGYFPSNKDTSVGFMERFSVTQILTISWLYWLENCAMLASYTHLFSCSAHSSHTHFTRTESEGELAPFPWAPFQTCSSCHS